MILASRILQLSLVGGLLLLGGCQDDFGAHCDLPTKIQQACRGTSSGTGMESSFSCSMKENLNCSSRICVIYQNSDSFCSETCTTDADCPRGARCMSFLPGFSDTENYCVPNSKITDTQG